MMYYQQRPTQEQRILYLLQERGYKGAFVWEFMLPRSKGGLGIAQYNARIHGLRERGFNIVNKTPGHFVLAEKEKPKKESWQAVKKRKRLRELEEKGQGKLI